MYIVTNRVPVAEGWEEAFEERFRQRAGQVEKQPGFVRMQVLKPDTAETPYVVLTTWRDKAAFEGWLGSEDFQAAHRNPLPKEAFTGQGRIESFEVIITAEGA
ncbi:antibiotic biosynthesis monooxygenase family protein [Thioalbus denitrificans]|uniref:Heme-degrading monooxygenase HmoA n=1 Tax=Thioalbus denitrificans TaxID=547122 RepID=A0A369CFK5_9GAMM|nr:antibiotic biosynthesis monooxygenase family protein [Thioalbus denitrificans]RCX32018.1 heme-degrading monooxygenase HmoA [Thioalbus denitrificans]